MNVAILPHNREPMKRAAIWISMLSMATLGLSSQVACAQSDGRGDVKVFRTTIKPLLEQYCVKCHGPQKQEGDLRLPLDGDELAAADDAVTLKKMLERLTLREMPPTGSPRPDVATQQRLTDWVRGRLQMLVHDIEAKLLLPSYGNYVRHEQLFGGQPTGAAQSPPRLWRVRPKSYQSSLRRLVDGDFTSPFELATDDRGFHDYAAFGQLDDSNAQLLLSNADLVATKMTSVRMDGGRIARATWETPDEVLAILDPNNEQPADEQIELAIRRQFHRVLFRDPTEEESKRLLEFTRRGIQRHGRLGAMRNMLSAVLLMPEALFRFEIGSHGKPDEHGRVLLAPRELAFAIAYALTDEAPDSTLLDAARRGRLASREHVGVQVERLLHDPQVAKPRILQFFREYFEYGTASDVFKDRDLFPNHDARMLVNDTDDLVRYILSDDTDVFRRLLTTNLSFVNHCVSDTGAVEKYTQRYGHLSYNLPHDWQWTPDQPVALPSRQRTGVLTQPSWLVAHSNNFDNNAIRRGKWVREKLLGGTVPDLPISIDARLPAGDSLTLRKRMEVTRQEACWKCHERMDPLGLPFERYDHFGRWRIEEKGEPVVTTGRIDLTGDPHLHCDVDDAVGMIRRLADSDLARQVFIRHAFRFWVSRNETPLDAATLQRADRDYVESGGSMNALIISLLISDSFLFRTATTNTLEDVH